jgi:hypothetical protein
MNLLKLSLPKDRRKDDLDEEIQAHLRMATEDRIERGEPLAEANMSARREFGNMALIKDITSDAWGSVWLEQLGQDLRYAVRQLWRSPGFTLTVILSRPRYWGKHNDIQLRQCIAFSSAGGRRCQPLGRTDESQREGFGH